MDEAVPVGQAIYRGCIIVFNSSPGGQFLSFQAKIIKAGTVRCIMRRTQSRVRRDTLLADLRTSAFDFIDRELCGPEDAVADLLYFPNGCEPTSIANVAVLRADGPPDRPEPRA